MTNGRRRLQIGLVVSFCVVAGALLALGTRDESSAETRNDRNDPGTALDATAVQTEAAKDDGRIASRKADAANAIFSLNGTVSTAEFEVIDWDGMELFEEHYEEAQDFFGWRNGNIDDTEFGHATAKCRIEYQREAYRGDSCGMSNRLFIGKDGDTSKVLQVEPHFNEHDVGHNDACQKWATCNAQAWIGRDAPETSRPVVHDATQSFPQFEGLTPDTSDAEWLAMYEAGHARLEKKVADRWDYIQQQEALGEWSLARRNNLYSSYRVDQSRLEDYRIMIEMLRARLQNQ